MGIGRACAERMAEEGACIVLADVHDERGNAIEMQLRDRGFRVRYAHCDVAREQTSKP